MSDAAAAKLRTGFSVIRLVAFVEVEWLLYDVRAEVQSPRRIELIRTD
jgi:hypothetical protein